ncbi:hypothetical protein NMB0197 [Neisseria meningitidis MC58]|uniref:Uncharacterized protein n=1 Tax=Neisseria meningitidis serogroup B (strain ATCC BAA-335 / MC58) TaxID=122586 RepID=Q9K1F7_NEIMB|nr:hypothetical protein NMB0197 [Neisseria meningitidis MC58]
MHVPENRVRKGRIQKAIKIDAAVCLPRSERCGRKNGGRLLLVIVMPVFWAVCVWDLGPAAVLLPRRNGKINSNLITFCACRLGTGAGKMLCGVRF